MAVEPTLTEPAGENDAPRHFVLIWRESNGSVVNTAIATVLRIRHIFHTHLISHNSCDIMLTSGLISDYTVIKTIFY